jgi:epoxyqueuosine reductase
MHQITSSEIKARALELGLDKTGIVPAEALSTERADLFAWLDRGLHGKMNYMARDPEKRLDPRALLPSAKSVVSVALNYFTPGRHSNIEGIGKISRYAWGDDYHDVLRDKLKSLLEWVHSDVDRGRCVDSPAMDGLGVRAGIG